MKNVVKTVLFVVILMLLISLLLVPKEYYSTNLFRYSWLSITVISFGYNIYLIKEL